MAYHFNTRIEITQKVMGNSPYPDDFDIETIAKPWADIKTIRGTESEVWKLTVNEEPIRFIIRYREGINTKQQVNYNGKEYNIQSVANDDGKNQTLTIFAVHKG